MKLIFKETEEIRRGMGHGVEFYYTFDINDMDIFARKDTIAFLWGYEWVYGNPCSITILIRPISSAVLRKRGQQPEIIISEVKEAIDLLLLNTPSHQHVLLTEHVTAWFNT